MNKCLTCDKETKNKKYCSRTCHDTRPVTIVTNKCKQCHKEFQIEYNHRYQKYCSYDCANEFRRIHSFVVCKYCDKEFDTKGKDRIYCSNECLSKASRVVSTCKNCGKEFMYYISKKKKYCCKECYSAAINGKTYKEIYGEKRAKEIIDKRNETFQKGNYPNWQGGKSFEEYGKDFNKKQKFQIRRRDKFTCQECGLKEEDHYVGSNKRSLIVHHIDYDKKNNSEYNHITLCNNCNLKVNGNREYWKKYFESKICQLYVNMYAMNDY